MAGYIEREAAVHVLMNRGRYLTKDLVMDAAYEVSKIPAADVVPVVHGEWRKIPGQPHLIECSACRTTSVEGEYKFCSNCGTKMDGE